MYFESSSSSSSPDTRRKNTFPIPRNYTFVRVLGEGGCGTVIECVKKGTGEHVAIKVPNNLSLAQESLILKKLMQHHLDECNIIKYKGDAFKSFKRLLVLEKLDITLEDYLDDLKQPMRLENIRTVIQQMAVALNALKGVGVIHTDLKTNNIMMVDQKKQPFKVKLTDFGLAMFRSEARAGRQLQIPAYRAPEIILGLPFSEAIDVWSLGCVLAKMVARVVLFRSRSEYCLLQYMISLMGPPPQRLIEAGRKSKIYFYKLSSGRWLLKTPMEYIGNNALICKRHPFGYLEELKTMRLEKDNPAEADERRECIELLKAMLQWDEKDRITPSGILNHPFITKSYLNSSSSHLRTCSESEPSTSGVLVVQHADPVYRIHLTGSSDEDSDPEDNMAEDDNENDVKEQISVVGKTVEGTEDRDGKHNVNTENSQDKNNDDNKNNVIELISVDEDSLDIQTDTEDSGLEDNESEDDMENIKDLKNNVVIWNRQDMRSIDDHDNSVEEIRLSEYSLDCTTFDDTDDSEDSESDESTDSSEVSETSSDIEDSETSEVYKRKKNIQVKQNLQDRKDNWMEQNKTKKKKNCFRRFFSWMKKTFCSCCCVSDVMD